MANSCAVFSIARVVTQEIVKNFTQKSDEAFDQQDKLLTKIYLAKG